MLNKFRKIEYTDDGCTSYECLACGKEAEVRNAGFAYCSYCGTKWDGELKWDEDRQYERRKLGHGATHEHMGALLFLWRIETRCNAFGKGAWMAKGGYRKITAAAALRWLRSNREEVLEEDLDDPLPAMEFRLRIYPSKRLPLP
jgi:hypothetical protein